MKFKVILLALIGGSLVASEAPLAAPRSPSVSELPVSPKYKMPATDTILKVLNDENNVLHSTFFYERNNAGIACELVGQEFTRKELVERLHLLTQPGVQTPTRDPLCSRKASLLLKVAQELPTAQK